MVPKLATTAYFNFYSNWFSLTTQRCIFHVTKRALQQNVHPRTSHECPEGEYRYGSTLSLTSALDGVGGQRHAPAALPPYKDPVPIV